LKILTKGIEKIKNAELSAVSFIRDYIELHFDGPVLRLIGDVLVKNHGQKMGSNDLGFKDMICRNIGRKVSSININDEMNSIEIKFHGDDVVEVKGTIPGLEYAHFISSAEGDMWIWESD